MEASIENHTHPPHLWDRVVCAADLSVHSRWAAIAAAQLAPAGADLTLCAVLTPAAQGGVSSLDGTPMSEAQELLGGILDKIETTPAPRLHLREGPKIRLLLEELAVERATLLVVGAEQQHYGVTAAMLRNAPCAVLVGREQSPEASRLLVGFDDSGPSHRALCVAGELATRLGRPLHVVAAHGAEPPEAGWAGSGPEPPLAVTRDPRDPAEALIDASSSASLLVLGSRHLPGAAAQASVSEVVALGARSSVLVVR